MARIDVNVEYCTAMKYTATKYENAPIYIPVHREQTGKYVFLILNVLSGILWQKNLLKLSTSIKPASLI